jgi:hypothetical protein
MTSSRLKESGRWRGGYSWKAAIIVPVENFTTRPRSVPTLAGEVRQQFVTVQMDLVVHVTDPFSGEKLRWGFGVTDGGEERILMDL